MKTWLLLVGVLVLSTGSFSAIVAQEPERPAPTPSAEELAKLALPGPEHEELAKYAGDWTLKVSMGSGPGALTFEGTAKSRTIVGGRFLQIDYSAKGATESTEGQFSLAFDRRHGRYDLVAMDSFGAYWATSRGKKDAETGKLKLFGKDDDPQMQAMGLSKEFAHVVDFRGPDSFAIEVWFVDTRTPQRRQFKYMEYAFERNN